VKLHIIFALKYNKQQLLLLLDKINDITSKILEVTEVHWRINATLGFKFRSHFTAHCGRRAASSTTAVLLAGGSSRVMLASARSLVVFCLPLTQKLLD